MDGKSVESVAERLFQCRHFPRAMRRHSGLLLRDRDILFVQDSQYCVGIDWKSLLHRLASLLQLRIENIVFHC